VVGLTHLTGDRGHDRMDNSPIRSFGGRKSSQVSYLRWTETGQNVEEFNGSSVASSRNA